MIVVSFIRKYFIKIVSILLAFLFIYAAASKLLDFENFQVQLAQSPLLSAYAGIISYGILIVEFGIAVLLLITQYNRLGLYASVGLMSGFTIYIYLILNFSDFIPCSCGGILEKLGWEAHLIFNIFFLLLAMFAIYVKARSAGRTGRKDILFSGLLTVFSCLIVLILFQRSEYIIKKENNFTRRFLLHPILQDKSYDLGVNSYYFAGVDDGNIYLGNTTAPLFVTTIDIGLTSISFMKAKLDHSDHPFRNLKVQVRPPFYYMFDGTVPVIYRGNLGDSLTRTISYGDGFFNQLAVLDSMKFAIRTQKSSDKQYTLASLDLNRSKKLELKPEILEKQIDGVFDVDGILSFGYNTDKVVYTYVYRNQYVIFDSSFNVLHRLNTIDTTSRAQISVTRLGDGKNKMNAPPFSVNKGAAVSGDLLFNQSNLRGKLEPKNSWKTSTIIDVYRTDQQRYLGSFYIRHRNDTAMSAMVVNDNYLYVLIGNEIIRYKITKNAFK